MGKEKTTVGTDRTTRQNQEQQQQFEATPEEQRLNALILGRQEALDRSVTGTQQAGLNLSTRLLQGQNLPGFLGGLPGGISPEVTQNIVTQSIADIQPQLQAAGLLNSGVNVAESARLASGIRTQAEQFNLQNRMDLLGLAFSGQLQAQQPMMQQQGQLASNLQGLRAFTGSSTGFSNVSGTQTTKQMNPFLKSFQQSLGGGLGSGLSSGIFGAGQGATSGGGAQAGFFQAAAAGSDIRMKDHIKRVGQTDDGFPVYTFRYKGDHETRMGVMAQDVEKTKPEAVTEINGMKHVYYDMIGGE